MRTTGRTLLISGGSRGLGLFMVQEFLRAGNNVASFARSETEAVRGLRDMYAERFHFEPIHAVDRAGLRTFVAGVAQQFGVIDALINNAAMGQDELLVHTAEERIAQIVEVNITAPILLTRLVLKRMLLQPHKGSVVSISSICGSRGYAGLSVYAASKGALDAFTRAMARELGEAGVRFNSIAPGFFESRMSSVLSPNEMETIRRRTPTGELSNLAQVVAVADLLLSGETNVNGQTIFVDGGITI